VAGFFALGIVLGPVAMFCGWQAMGRKWSNDGNVPALVALILGAIDTLLAIIACQPQNIATGPSTMPSAKKPATAQIVPMIPSVARSGPVRCHVRPRDRGYPRVPCPKPAIINSLGSVDSSASECGYPGSAGADLRALPPSSSAPRPVRPPMSCGGLDPL
jgi:hypothetical protein